jgi:hypothetical protein
LVLAFVAVSAIAAFPGMKSQWERSRQVRNVLAGKSPAERAALLDNPAYPVAQTIAGAAPADACVAVLAYAGPAAAEYYNARFAYLLYPRRVEVFAGSAASKENCAYLAVFRDTPQNLDADPFAGQWSEDELAARLSGAELLARDAAASVYRLP